jgi:hypothetical protein
MATVARARRDGTVDVVVGATGRTIQRIPPMYARSVAAWRLTRLRFDVHVVSAGMLVVVALLLLLLPPRLLLLLVLLMLALELVGAQ